MDTTTAATTNSPKQSTGSTPESLRARFALLVGSVAFSNACHAAFGLAWDDSKVCPKGGFGDPDIKPTPWTALLGTLSALIDESIDNRNQPKVALYSAHKRAAEELQNDISDWHNHCDDDSSPSFLDAAQEVGVSR